MSKNLAVFCGASSGNLTLYSDESEKLADLLSRAGVTLVYGGAKVGLMGRIANRMLQNGARVIGVIPKSLVTIEIAHEGLSELHVVESMNARKALIAEISDGFIMLPGGSGSLDEFFEMFTLWQLGYHSKPCGIFNVSGYYDHLIKFLDHAVSQGFLHQNHRDKIMIAHSAECLIDNFAL